jgi:aminoglycoside/choline kinase family phosphotransferase
VSEPLDRWLVPAQAAAAFGGAVAARAGIALDGAHLAATDVHYKTYRKPGSAHRASLAVTWRITPRTGPTTHVHARFHRAGALPADVAAPLVLPEHDALVWVWPDDPVLTGLRAVVGDTPTAAARVVNWRAGQRCTTRLAAGDDGRYAKTFDVPARRVAFDRLATLHAATAGLHSPLAVPEPIAFDTATATMTVREVAGSSLADCLGTADAPLLLDRAAAALAALHGMTLEGLATIDRAALLVEASKKAAKLVHAHPALAPALASALDRLERAAVRLPSSTHVTLHGDCHAGQWIARSGPAPLTLVDFDELARGEAAHDVANFLADLAVRGLPAAVEARAARAFADGHARHAGAPLDPRVVYWHLAVQLLNRAHRRHVQRRACAAAAFAPLLERIDAALLRAEATAPGRGAR